MQTQSQTKYLDYVMVRIDEKSKLQVWVKLPPSGK
jgi:hypothetical protein